MDTKKVEFTSEQFLKLMKLVYLGRWMVSSHRDETDKNFEDIEQHVYSQAKNFGHEAYVDFDSNYGKHFPSADIEDEMDPVIQDYDDYTFWDELAWRMAERDFDRKYDHAQVLCMTNDEIFRQKNILADKYFDEFTTNGIEKLILK
jgi:hypothetical protein